LKLDRKKLIGLFFDFVSELHSLDLLRKQNTKRVRYEAMQERMISELKLDEKQAAEYQKIFG
jgi:hypothetical protein